MPEISVIVPVYKVENYIHRCVDSIRNQTFTDFELILVDDGSPDNCGVICDEYAAKDSRITVIHKENGGVSSARNMGLNAAQGQYIMFCDGDDYVADNWCETMYRAISLNPNAFVCHDVHRVEVATVPTVVACGKQETVMETMSYFDLYKRGISAYAVNKIYDSEILRKHGLRFDENISLGEDAILNAQYCGLCRECIYIDRKLYYYVQWDDSIMHRYHVNRMEQHMPIFMCRVPLISKADLAEYCDIWLYQFLKLFDNVFDSRNTWSFLKKIRYNQQMICSEEFRFCLEHATGKKENPLAIKILRTHNYYLFWLFDQLVKLKGKLRRKLT